jgi:hypothetical protein
MNMLRKVLCFFSIMTISGAAFSAEVKKINEKTGAIYIDEGESTGFSKGKKVCLFDGEKRVACGRILKAVKKKAILKVPKSKVASVHTGFTVSVVESSDASKTGGKSPYMMSVTLGAHFLPSTPGIYNNLNYVAPTTGATSLWEASSVSSQIIVPPAMSLEVELLSLGLIGGFRYGVYPNSSQTASYDSTTEITTDMTASDLGVYFDYIVFRRWGLNFGLGLDIDISSVTMSGSQTATDGSVNELFSATSSLNVFSARIPVSYKLTFDSFGISAGLALIVPLYATNPAESLTTPTSGGAAAPATAAQIVDQDADLSDSLNHTKGTIAFDVNLGVFYQF